MKACAFVFADVSIVLTVRKIINISNESPYRLSTT